MIANSQSNKSSSRDEYHPSQVISNAALSNDLTELSKVITLKQKTYCIRTHKLDFLIEYCHAPACLSPSYHSRGPLALSDDYLSSITYVLHMASP